MMGWMSFLCVRAAQLGRIFMRDVNDFAREGFGVRIGAGAGAGQADVHGLDAQRFHQVQDFDFFARCWDRGRRDFASRREEFRR